ncbi:vWA domain-containing protein, partial [Micromonospora sp. 4G55]|uniref:vWA domain-containing protein n=1 Tax=Micromonospora sp. 4G55 TaxID=2806102 RepID=UPI001A3A3253
RVAALLVAVLAVGLAAVPEPLGGCAGPVELRVAAAPDDLVTYQAVAAAYESWTAARAGGCRTTNVFVYPAAPREVAQGLQLGWSESAGRPATEGDPGTPGWYPADVGPRPDAWFPGAEMPSQQVLNLTTVRDYLTVARSPLVLAVPRALVDPARDDADRQRSLSWPELFAKASRAPGEEPTVTASGRRVTGTGWQVVRPDPAVSPEARMVDVALYDGAPDTAWIRQQVEQRLEAAQDERGFPLGSLAAVLCRQRQLAADPSAPAPPAVVTTEQALVQFNLGERLGDGCVERGRPASGRALVAFYPELTPGVDHRLVLLRWPDSVQSPAARAAADDLRRWLTGPGRDELLARGFRVPGRDGTGPALTEENGVLPGWLLDNPQWELVDGSDALALNTADQRYREARRRPGCCWRWTRPARCWRRRAGAPGSTWRWTASPPRCAASAAGTRSGCGRSPPLPGERRAAAGGRGADRARDEALVARLRRTVPAGDTPLYRTIDAAIGEVRRLGGGDEHLRAVVVLTDGRDTASDGLVPRVEGDPPVRLYVIAVGEASCDDRVRTRTLRQTARASGGQCLQAEASTVDRALTGLFRQLWEKGAGQ